VKLVREHINEKFQEYSDPISDLGIGMKELIKQLVKEKGYKYIYAEDDLLWICVQEGKVEFVKYLLDAGADVHTRDDYALRLASLNRHTEVVKLLLDVGADVHAYNDAALRWASAKGRTEVVKLLLDAGADVHADNDAALRVASEYGHTEVVKLLLDAGADVHANNDAVLRWASSNGHTEVVKLLKDYIAKEKGKVVKESKKYIDEGIADRYAEKEFHIPDETKEVKTEEKDKDKIVYHFNKTVYIVKNPTNLNFAPANSRAFISKQGDLYVLNLNFQTHEEMIEALSKIGEIENQPHWWVQLPKKFLTLQKIKGQNAFVIGESNEPLQPYTNKERRIKYSMPSSVEKAKKYYLPFIELARKKHPQFKFYNKTLKELTIHESIPGYVQKATKDMISDLNKPGLHKKIKTTLQDAKGDLVKVYAINGDFVRSKNPGLNFDQFVDGGHHYVDSYPGYKKNISEDEIWIDDVFEFKPQDFRAILLHEFTERNLMKYKKWSYSKAHEYANKKETAYRERVKK
jgi:hypothetical protein